MTWDDAATWRSEESERVIKQLIADMNDPDCPTIGGIIKSGDNEWEIEALLPRCAPAHRARPVHPVLVNLALHLLVGQDDEGALTLALWAPGHQHVLGVVGTVNCIVVLVFVLQRNQVVILQAEAVPREMFALR